MSSDENKNSGSHQDDIEAQQHNDITIKRNLFTIWEESDIPVEVNTMSHLFVVMKLSEMSFKQLFNSVPSTILNEDDIITILYNQICVLNFLHSSGIIHGDVQPSNMLIDSECTVMTCNFTKFRSNIR